MGIVSLGSGLYDTIIDINNGQFTKSFTQADDTTYDVSVSSNSTATQTIAGSGGGDLGEDDIDRIYVARGSTYSATFTVEIEPNENWNIGSIDIYVNGSHAASAHENNGVVYDSSRDPLTSISIRHPGSGDFVGNVEYNWDIELDADPQHSTTVNSVTQS